MVGRRNSRALPEGEDDELFSPGGPSRAELAHEINNPLTYALFNTESLRADVAVLETLRKLAESGDSQAVLGEIQRWFEGVNDFRERLAAAIEGIERVRDIVRDLQKAQSHRRPTPSPPLAATGNRDAAPAIARALRVLVVDDEPQVGKAVHRMLCGEHQVTVVRSGPEAQQLLDNQLFDVIVCDLMMPEFSGMDLHGHLEGSRPELARRMVFMTGGASTEQALNFLFRVENVCLGKPFKVAELRRALQPFEPIDDET